MAFLAADYDGMEHVFDEEPQRIPFDEKEPHLTGIWKVHDNVIYYSIVEMYGIELPRGSIEKLIGRKLTWEDEPVEI